ncbi:hypothetical protein EMIHUDRAFT_462323 [Emiliania huxleyi CCMP1516]|uniref:Uncharacterized protein n=2 Tax=Emiliania huxleyi TaxID=2903 RepID=A0A0D3KLQ4_EMIH1|nr:hypothetical protein EMIHUDRAFT_462323 [Emiliania huxleyi CCMP1516]EOD36689.1 hypothetical protein EMIHUDRAFT_462323 [Emiliania huxleyi CCMP1516]|eukprot:XP_005789118.1 hypothetical protein EMIHUDRAFT_462323 [Emiliania huxleyi CCMP1516]
MSVIGASVLAAALALSPTPHVASGARCHPSFAPRTLVTKTAATPLLAGQPLAVRWQRAGGPPLLSAANGAAGRGLVRSAVVGGAFAALAVAGRGGRLGLLLLQTLAVCWPAWSAVRLWRNGKRRAALTLALSAAARRFCSRWWQYLTIPLFAGAVGWLTNKVAVDMIFYPVEFGGLRLRTYPNQPLGWIGWQGIVPAKAGEMAARITDLVTNKLVDVEVVFRRLSPGKLASLLGPGVDRIAEDIVADIAPAGAAQGVVGAGKAASVRQLVDFDEIVVGGMVREKQLLIDLFQRCGKARPPHAELAFLVNSGFSFGCALGVVQMLIWLLYERAWTLAVGGAVVGYLTNWLALKLIFEPVEPTRFGPWVVQGLFLKRQHEVSEEFAEARPAAMTEKLLSSESIWDSVLHGSGGPKFAALLRARTSEFMSGAAAVVYSGSDPTAFGGAAHWRGLEERASERILQLLPRELPLAHGYIDGALDLKDTLKTNLRRLSPREFEGLLHPIFQQDELTLLLVGTALGLGVGYVQAVLDARSKRDDPNYDERGRRVEIDVDADSAVSEGADGDGEAPGPAS